MRATWATPVGTTAPAMRLSQPCEYRSGSFIAERTSEMPESLTGVTHWVLRAYCLITHFGQNAYRPGGVFFLVREFGWRLNIQL